MQHRNNNVSMADGVNGSSSNLGIFISRKNNFVLTEVNRKL